MILLWSRYWRAIKQLQTKRLWYIFVQPVVKNTNNRLVMENMFHSVNYRRMIQLQFTDDNCPMLVRFLVSTRLHLTLKSEKGRSNLKWYKTLWKTWYDLCVAVGWWSGHCVKSVQIRIFLWSEFSSIWTEYGDLLRKTPYSVWMRENTDQKNSVFAHFLRSGFARR